MSFRRFLGLEVGSREAPVCSSAGCDIPELAFDLKAKSRTHRFCATHGADTWVVKTQPFFGDKNIGPKHLEVAKRQVSTPHLPGSGTLGSCQ